MLLDLLGEIDFTPDSSVQMMNTKNTIAETSISYNQDLLDLLGLGGNDVIPTSSSISPAPLNGNDSTVNNVPAPIVGLGALGSDQPNIGDFAISNQPVDIVSKKNLKGSFSKGLFSF